MKRVPGLARKDARILMAATEKKAEAIGIDRETLWG